MNFLVFFLALLLTTLHITAQSVPQVGPCDADSDLCWDVIVANTCFAATNFGDKNQTLACIGDGMSNEAATQKVKTRWRR